MPDKDVLVVLVRNLMWGTTPKEETQSLPALARVWDNAVGSNSFSHDSHVN